MQADWQTWVTFGIGAVALAYVARRWWPRPATSASACGTAGAEPAACGSGCGGCGSGGSDAPRRDHSQPPRAHPIHLVRPDARHPAPKP